MQDLAEKRPWPARTVLLLALGGLFGLAFHLLIRGSTPWSWTDNPLRLGAAAVVATAGLSFALSLERQRPLWSVAFGLAVGLVVGGVTLRNGSWSLWGSNEGWQLFAALLAVTIAVPLFQTVRDAGRLRLDYPALHAHSWTDGILLAAALVFMLASFLLAELLAQLFLLIGLHWLEDMLRKAWVDFAYTGAALGAAIGLLRDRDQVLGVLQRVATAIVAVLTPLLALGLVLFVLALPFTGLAPLWEKTKDTTPILLFCILGAFVLINATIGSSDEEEEARSPVLRYAALGLGAVMLPLGIVAAISMGKRVAQHGLTPDRLWAIIVVAIALACALGYAAAIVHRRRAWAEDVRRANIGLALGTCAVALFLALPIVSFGAMSAGNQLWRIRTGKVAPEKADWAALRFDFGPSGQRAVERLAATSPDPRTRALAMHILAAKDRYAATQTIDSAKQALLPRIVQVIPQAVPVPQALTDLLFNDNQSADPGLCVDHGRCLLRWQPGQTVAIAMRDGCAIDPRYPQQAPSSAYCDLDTQVLEQTDSGWRRVETASIGGIGAWDRKSALARRAAALAGRIELRTVQGRQLFIDGQPAGEILR